MTVAGRCVLSHLARRPNVTVMVVAVFLLVTTFYHHQNWYVKPEWSRFGRPTRLFIETIIGCSGENIGCFSLLSRSDTVMPLVNHVTREGCLYHCFENSFIFAGHLPNKSCVCGRTIEDIVANDSCDPLCSSVHSDNCLTSDRIQVFMLNVQCQLGFTKFTPEMDSVGCVWTPKELQGRSRAWVMAGLPIHQCVLHCEKQGFQLAVPMEDLDSCLCSDSLSLFESPERLWQQYSYCSGEAYSSRMNYVYQTFANTDCPAKSYEDNHAPLLMHTKYWDLDVDGVKGLIERTLSIHISKIQVGGKTPSTEEFNDRLIILPVRSIRDIMAKRYQSISRSKEEKSRLSLRTKEDIRMFTLDYSREWLDEIEKTVALSTRVMLIYEEDLFHDPVRELRRIATYYNANVKNRTLDRNLMCALLESIKRLSTSRRPKKATMSEMFSSVRVRNFYSSTLKRLSNFLKKHGLPPPPISYYGSL